MGSAGTACIVASKLPMSLEMKLQEKRTRREYGRDGLHEVVEWAFVGKAYKINGCNIPPVAAADGKRWPQMVNGGDQGVALTFNVPEDHCDEWFKQNKDLPPVKNGFIYKVKTIDAAKGKAKDLKGKLSGFEPLTPDSDPRLPKKTITREVDHDDPNLRGYDVPNDE